MQVSTKYLVCVIYVTLHNTVKTQMCNLRNVTQYSENADV